MATDDFFHARLDSMIDMRHPLAVLATRMPWVQIEALWLCFWRTRIAMAAWSKMPISSAPPCS